MDTSRVQCVEWHEADLIGLELDAVDFALLRECDASTSMADKVLAVELLVRKYEMQAQRLLAALREE